MILSIKNLTKNFYQAGRRIEVLRGLELDISKGETVAILGQSGCGKSTLLSLIAGLDQANSGTISIEGENLALMTEDQMARFRACHIGIVFQQFHLMPHLTALENVALPLELAGNNDAEAKARAILTEVGLQDRLDHFPHQLSGGECQRVAIARAFVVHPDLLLADEPSGNLDSKTGGQVMNLLFERAKRDQMTLVLVTHNQTLAHLCHRQFQLINGKLESL